MDPTMTSGVYTPTDEDRTMWEANKQPQINVIHNTIVPICYDCHASGVLSTNVETSLRISFGLAVIKYTCRNCDTVIEISMDMYKRESR